MNSRDYIISKINELVSNIPNIKIRYENYYLTTHIIEISPIDIFKSKLFREVEKEIVFDFIGKFNDENISFISTDSLVGIDKVDYQVGSTIKYETVPAKVEFHSNSKIIVSSNYNKVGYAFDIPITFSENELESGVFEENSSFYLAA